MSSKKPKQGYKLVKPLFEKIEIPKEWEIAPLENITKITRLAGYEYSTIWEHDPKGKIIALRGFNIQKNRLDLTDIDRISEQLSNQLSRSKLHKNDIVFPCVGSIGNAALILENDKFDTFRNYENIIKVESDQSNSNNSSLTHRQLKRRWIEMYENLKDSYDDPEEGLRRFTQAYLACVSAVDDNIGQVMKAIDNSNLKDNTIVVLVSDHGWTLGEKEHIYKNSPWEESTRIPMTIRAPGVTNSNGLVNHPVSLIDIYPTLLDLAGLDMDTKKNEKGRSLDGYSLVPFLKDPETKNWEGPDAALTVVYSSDDNKNNPANHHYSVRTKDWRYIIYDSGKEELYHNAEDPKEWNNLVFNKTHPKRDEMVEILKQMTYPMVPNGLKQ